MAIIVQKFGGTSVRDPNHIRDVANRVLAEQGRGNQVAVVVSAMADVTNSLIALAKQVSNTPSLRDMDNLLATGEQTTSALLAMTLKDMGVEAKSWQGWQIPIKTDDAHGKARIHTVNVEKMKASLESGHVATVAGFQGINAHGDITTLGRGGSDTSAVALAALLGARCDIYTDVDGVYTADPRIVDNAQKLSKVSLEEMFELAGAGSKVLQARSVEMALRFGVPVQVLSSLNQTLGSDFPGTLVTPEGLVNQQNPITGIAHTEDDARITLKDVPDVSGTAAKTASTLAENNIAIDMIVQSTASNKKADITFSVAKTDMDKAVALLEKKKKEIGFSSVCTDNRMARVTLVGAGIPQSIGIESMAFEALARKDVNLQVIQKEGPTIGMLVKKHEVVSAVNALHDTFELGRGIEKTPSFVAKAPHRFFKNRKPITSSKTGGLPRNRSKRFVLLTPL